MSIKEHIYWPKDDGDGISYLEHTEIVLGSDYDFDDNGIEFATEPEFETYWTMFDETYRCDTAGEVTRAIEDLLKKASIWDDVEGMRKLLNSSR